ncbi:MAG: SEC-C domain-containing protein [Chitinophagaceae bacterium]|nr:SEC-C domain-containing protein [Chitinophagaceae bacterium]
MNNQQIQQEPKLGIKIFLDELKNASINSRKMIIILVFTGVFILMSHLNSRTPSWFASRMDNQFAVQDYCCFEEDSVINDSLRINNFPMKSLGAFIENCEKAIAQNSKDLQGSLDIIEKHKKSLFAEFYSEEVKIRNPNQLAVKWKDTNLEGRLVLYKKINDAVKYAKQKHIKTKKQLEDLIKKQRDTRIDNIEMIKVPILGVSFDINYLGWYAGFVLLVLYWLTFVMLEREYVNTKIAFKNGWAHDDIPHFILYECMSMSQVLHKPRKLFRSTEYQNTLRWIVQNLSYIAVICPFLIYVLVFYYDYNTVEIGSMFNSDLTRFSIILEGCLGVFIFILLYDIIIQKLKTEHFWRSRTFEFNFEYILSKVLPSRFEGNKKLLKELTKYESEKKVPLYYGDLENIKLMCYEGMLQIKKINSYGSVKNTILQILLKNIILFVGLILIVMFMILSYLYLSKEQNIDISFYTIVLTIIDLAIYVIYRKSIDRNNDYFKLRKGRHVILLILFVLAYFFTKGFVGKLFQMDIFIGFVLFSWYCIGIMFIKLNLKNARFHNLLVIIFSLSILLISILFICFHFNHFEIARVITYFILSLMAMKYLLSTWDKKFKDTFIYKWLCTEILDNYTNLMLSGNFDILKDRKVNIDEQKFIEFNWKMILNEFNFILKNEDYKYNFDLIVQCVISNDHELGVMINKSCPCRSGKVFKQCHGDKLK